LVITRIARILLTTTGVLFLLGCEGAIDPSPTPPLAAGAVNTASILAPSPTNLAVCSKAKYDSVSALIGPMGGKLSVGSHKFEVPAVALSKTVRISMVRPADSTASVRFHPEGLQFNTRALPKLTLDFSSCKKGRWLDPLPPRVAYVTERGGLIETLVTLLLDEKNQKVTSKVSHFSRYAVAW
jgi:hypothetical protein